jgi:hypothetical protein
MDSITRNWNTDENYWLLNPVMKTIKVFNELYKKDKSKGKTDSSKIMWAIYYIMNPDSMFFNMPDKFEQIAKSHLKDPKFKWATISKEMELYKTMVLSDAERALVGWGEIMNMRDTSLKDLYKEALKDKDVKSLKDLDTMLSNTPKMFEDYKKIRKDYEEEKTTKKGKHINSLSES